MKLEDIYILYRENRDRQKTHATVFVLVAHNARVFTCCFAFIRLVAKRSTPARDSSLSRAPTPIYEPS